MFDKHVQRGTITQLTVQQHDPNRVSVFLDGTFAFGVSVDVMLDFGLRVGVCLSPTDQQRLQAAEQVQAARVKAWRYLAARPRTRHEVQQKLRQQGFPDHVITQVMAYLEARGNLNDAAYAQAYLSSRLHRRGDGPQRVRRDLHRHGVRRDIVEETLQQHLDADEVLEAARLQARKRWPRLAGDADAVRHKKLLDFLRRRGFAYDTAHQVVQECARGELDG